MTLGRAWTRSKDEVALVVFIKIFSTSLRRVVPECARAVTNDYVSCVSD